MAVTTAHKLYAIDVNTVGVGAAYDVFIDQISQWGLAPDIVEMVLGGDGAVDATFAALQTQDPKLSWSTSKLATVLATIGISGLKIAADVDELGLRAWLQKIDEGGTIASGSVHTLLTVKEGIIVPRQLTANNESAILTMEAIASWDGTNDPIIVTANQALVGTPSVSEFFVVGKVALNGTTINGVQSVTIDFGLQVVALRGDGSQWPTFVFIQARRPSISITTLDTSVLATFGLGGIAQSATDSVIYLRKVAEGGTRVADATPEHISFSVDEGRISTRSIGGSDGPPLAAEILVTPTYGGSNAVIAISTATAIT